MNLMRCARRGCCAINYLTRRSRSPRIITRNDSPNCDRKLALGSDKLESRNRRARQTILDDIAKSRLATSIGPISAAVQSAADDNRLANVASSIRNRSRCERRRGYGARLSDTARNDRRSLLSWIRIIIIPPRCGGGGGGAGSPTTSTRCVCSIYSRARGRFTPRGNFTALPRATRVFPRVEGGGRGSGKLPPPRSPVSSR